MGLLQTVNVGRPAPNPYKTSLSTGIAKVPTAGAIEVRDPGPKNAGLGSGLAGDFIGDGEHHGGSEQAVYAFAREDLDDWERRLLRDLPNGSFGENLTTLGIDVNESLVGERWRLGDDVVLQVTAPRIPCATFRGWVGETGWLKLFTDVARPGAYLRVLVAGTVRSGDVIEVIRRPPHEVTVSIAFRALTTAGELLPALLAAGDDLPDGIRDLVMERTTSRGVKPS